MSHNNIKFDFIERVFASLSRASSSRVYHTSYPVLVHRPALSDWPSSRPRLTTTPLAFSLPSAPRITTWSGDFHPGSHVPCLAHTQVVTIADEGGVSVDHHVIGFISFCLCQGLRDQTIKLSKTVLTPRFQPGRCTLLRRLMQRPIHLHDITVGSAMY